MNVDQLPPLIEAVIDHYISDIQIDAVALIKVKLKVQSGHHSLSVFPAHNKI
jgi:hypothetical protein